MMLPLFRPPAPGLFPVALAKPLWCISGPYRVKKGAVVVFSGEVPEWLNGAVSKTVDLRKEVRGFESHPLR